MQLTHLALLLSITLASSLSQKLTPNAVTSLLQGILSPENTEQVMQILSAAVNKKRALPNVPGTVHRRFAIADNVPRTVMRTEAPKRMAQLVQRPEEMCMKKNVLVQTSNNVILQNGNQMVLPKNMVVQRRAEAVLPKNIIVQRRTETVSPKNVMIQNGRKVTPRNVIVRKNEMPKRMVVQSNDYALSVPQMRTPEVVQQKVFVNPQMRPEIQQKVFVNPQMRPEVQQKVFVNPQMRPEVQQKVLINPPQTTEYVTFPQEKVLNCNDNPFLPAASPVSALAAFSSSSLPPAMPQSRGQFLRKIPIPPPTL